MGRDGACKGCPFDAGLARNLKDIDRAFHIYPRSECRVGSTKRNLQTSVVDDRANAVLVYKLTQRLGIRHVAGLPCQSLCRVLSHDQSGPIPVVLQVSRDYGQAGCAENSKCPGPEAPAGACDEDWPVEQLRIDKKRLCKSGHRGVSILFWQGCGLLSKNYQFAIG